MERNHVLRADRSWLPSSVRWQGRLASATVWGGSAVALGAVLVTAPAVLLLWKALVLAGAGSAVAGRQIGRGVTRRQLAKVARGEVELANLNERDEGELVIVRGRIESTTPLTGLLVDTVGVYRRMHWRPAGSWVHESAVDFALVDARGNRVLIQAAGARWMTQGREPWAYPVTRFDRDGVSPRVRELARGARSPTLQAAERVLEIGTEVAVVGYKTASADVGGSVVDYRMPPQRATLRSGPDLPLVITGPADPVVDG
jgi:hypothetical protein